jgi:hypothetical protein
MQVQFCCAIYLRYVFLVSCASAQTKHTQNLSITSRIHYLSELPATSLLFKAVIG